MTDNQTSLQNQFEYDQWRSQFLNTVLRISCALGIVLIGTIIPSATSTELTLFGILYLLLLFVTFRDLRYEIKAGTFLSTGYFIGLFSLLRFGSWSDAVVFFLAVAVFTSLLFNKQIDRWILALNSITITSIGVLDVLDIYNPTSTLLPTQSIWDWATYVADYIAVSIMLVWAVNLLKQEFKEITEKYQSALGLLSTERTELEQRVVERTEGLIKKTDQLRASSYIARQTAEVSDLSSLLGIVVNLITDQFGFYHTGIFLINETGDTAVLQATSSQGGQEMVEMGYSLPVGGQNVVGYAAGHKTYRIALDVGADAVFFNNPNLPSTHSEIALPLVIRNRVLGVLDIQSDKSQAFGPDDIDVLQTLADQVAVAIENAKLLDEAQSAITQLEAVTTIRTREAWRQKLQKQNHAFTYTPIGLRSEILPDDEASAFNVPITLRGQSIGTITMTSKNNERWSKVDENLINEVAYQVGLAVDNIRLLENATQRALQEKTVGELASRFSQSLDIDNLLQTAARELGQIPEVSEVSVFIGQLPEQTPHKRRSKRTTG